MEKVRLNFNISNNDLDDYRKEVYNRILNSPHYKDIVNQGFTNEEIYKNASKFLEYIDDIEIEKNVKTYDDCLRLNKFDKVILVRNGDIIERDYVPLAPYKEHLDFLNKFIVKDFPSELDSASYTSVRKELKKAIKMMLTSGKWIYLRGAMRSGRTYTAVALINQKYAKEFDSIAFLNCPLRFKELSDLYFQDRIYFNELMNSYAEADYLVLDEFGSEYKSEIVRDSILIPLLKYRILNNKVTCFTSDFTLDQIGELYSFSKIGSNIMIEQFIKLLRDKISKEIVVSELSLY